MVVDDEGTLRILCEVRGRRDVYTVNILTKANSGVCKLLELHGSQGLNVLSGGTINCKSKENIRFRMRRSMSSSSLRRNSWEEK